MDVDAAYELVRTAWTAGRPAHGYLLVGAVRGSAHELAVRILKDVFTEHVEDRAHPDIHWLFPEKKTRVISVEAIHEKLIDPMGKTAFAGGWKAGVIMGADRLNKTSANAFLKLLEEPPPKTLFLLLTDQPEQLLPTIISRCQRIDLEDARSKGLLDPWLSRIVAALAPADLSGVTERAAAGQLLTGILADLKKHAAECVKADFAEDDEGPGVEVTDEEFDALVSSRYREFRADFLLTLMGWFRDLMALTAGGEKVPLKHVRFREVLLERARGLTRAAAFRNVEAVEELAVSFERNVPEAAALAFFTDRVNFGVKA